MCITCHHHSPLSRHHRSPLYLSPPAGQFYLGGVPYIQTGIVSSSNFSGCIENLYVNSTNFIGEVRERRGDYINHGGEFNCPVRTETWWAGDGGAWRRGGWAGLASLLVVWWQTGLWWSCARHAWCGG